MASPTRLQAMNDIDDRVDQKRKELINIANFISDQGLKIKQASTHDKVLDYFRGDNFHQIVLKHKEDILKKFKEIDSI